jgi:DHA1 family multidrug resistance protein-like MFS transporter
MTRNNSDTNTKAKSKNLSSIILQTGSGGRILVLSVVSLTVMMGSSIVSPSLALYAKQGLGANEIFVGSIIAGFAIGRVIFDIPSGMLTGKLGTSRAMLIGLMVLIVSTVAAGFAPNFWVLFATRVIEGIGSSIYVSGAITYVLLSGDSSQRGSRMSAYQSVIMLGPIMGPLIGAPVAAFYGLNSPYFAYAAIISLAFVAVLLLNRKGRLEPELNLKNGRKVTAEVKDTRLAAYLSTASIATFGFAFMRSGVYTTAMPLFAYGSLHLSVIDLGIIFASSSVANLLASFFSGKLTGKFGMGWPLIFSLSFAAIIVAAIPFSAVMVELLVMITALGLASGFFGQSVAWAADQVEEKVRKIKEEEESNNTQSESKQACNEAASTAGSYIAKGVGFNRMIGDIGLISGPIFVGYFITSFRNQDALWFLCFGCVSIVLALISISLHALSKKDLPVRVK